MDLVTLIAACALSVEPKVMHALIWEQSGGEPWSFSVPSESLPRVLPTIQDAIREAQATRPDSGRIRVGLTGLSTDPRSVTMVLFAPCPNITLAARRITQLVERCRATSKLDPIYCAIAAYHGTWDRADTAFAKAVRATVERDNAPNFDMPKDAYLDASDIASDAPMPGSHAAPTALTSTPDDRVRGWSSALFPAKPTRSAGAPADLKDGDRAADKQRPPGLATAAEARAKTLVDSLFVQRSSERRP